MNFFNPKSITLPLDKIRFKVSGANTTGELKVCIVSNKNKSATKYIYLKNVFDCFSENNLKNYKIVFQILD